MILRSLLEMLMKPHEADIAIVDIDIEEVPEPWVELATDENDNLKVEENVAGKRTTWPSLPGTRRGMKACIDEVETVVVTLKMQPHAPERLEK